MKKYSELAWYIFMTCIVPPAFMLAPGIRMMNLHETINHSYYFIDNGSFEIFATILHIPVGIVAYLMPNDMDYFVMFFLLFFMMMGPFMIFLFFATTYPPKCLRDDTPSEGTE